MSDIKKKLMGVRFAKAMNAGIGASLTKMNAALRTALRINRIQGKTGGEK